MSVSDSTSYILDDPSPPSSDDRDDDIDFLPSSVDSSSLGSGEDDDEDEEESDAEREWKESLQQLELLLTMVVVPFLGKYFGRKCAYWGWARYMQWKYPVAVVMTNKAAFRATGVVEAAASL
ncbi:MAG: hypothetical protein M1837_000065 [Sclerophora amabilis]|nr:MAG: hypothetical protein M1837_000065 [Sclerophora amabilis]